MVIKKLNASNPFADYGTVVKGTRFIGRDRFISSIRNRTLGNNYGNIAIMGLPRIGKTSLAWNALLAKQEEEADRGNYIAFVGTGTASDSNSFFKLLIASILNQLEFSDQQAKIFQKLKEIYDVLKKVEKDVFERNVQIQRFFRFLRRSGLRATFVLDEFDNAARIFKPADFQLLRELASKPDTQICLITVSRRTIQELEPENGAISNFYGIFSDLHLGLFDENDLNKYWQWVTSQGLKIDENYKVIISYFVGRHPFLIDQFNFHLFNILEKNSEAIYSDLINNTESDLRLSLYESLDSALDILKEEKLYSKAFQLVVGPVYDVTNKDEQRLLKYDFLKEVSVVEKERILGRKSGLTLKDGERSYMCFSDYLTEYFKIKSFDVEFWPLWERTENSVRALIKVYLEETFSSDWEEDYLKKNPSNNRNDLINKLRNERDKAQVKFPSHASSHIIDYTYPKDLYNLFISSDWNWFGKVFGEGRQEKKKWAKKFNHLAKVRNPIAHNNSQFIPEEDINLGKIYCEEILEKINVWRNDE